MYKYVHYTSIMHIYAIYSINKWSIRAWVLHNWTNCVFFTPVWRLRLSMRFFFLKLLLLCISVRTLSPFVEAAPGKVSPGSSWCGRSVYVVYAPLSHWCMMSIILVYACLFDWSMHMFQANTGYEWFVLHTVDNTI